MGFLTRALGRILTKLDSMGGKDLPPEVSVGRHTYGHDSGTFMVFPGSGKVTLGKFCSIAPGVKIFGGGEHRTDIVSTYPLKTLLTKADGGNYDATTKGPTTIGNDVWIGAMATVLSGVTIGDGAVIGSGSVVAADVPAYAIACGNPAKVTRSRFSPSQIERFLRIAWWDWDDETIKAREADFYGDAEAFLAKYDRGEQPSSRR